MATPTHASTEAPAPSGGLPQFDPQWWPGQIVWFSLIFVVVFFLMRQVFVPRIGGGIAERDAKIEGDIAGARALRDEADAQAQSAAAETAQARAASQRLATEAREKAKAEIAERLAAEEAKLAEATDAAEARIRAARDAAMTNVGAIASDTTAAIIARLTGKAATAAELSAALAGKA